MLRNEPAEIVCSLFHQDYGRQAGTAGFFPLAPGYRFVLIPVGSAVALARRYRAKALLNGVRSHGTTNIGSLSWQDFERLVGEGFRRRGFEVVEGGGAVPDGGIDLVLTRGNERFLVQCKQWRAQRVGVSVVR